MMKESHQEEIFSVLNCQLLRGSQKIEGVVALATCEDEYLVALSIVCEAICELNHQLEESIITYVDGKFGVRIEKNPM